MATTPGSKHFLIIGAGAAGLMAARELRRAGKAVTILEARDQCGGRIYPLPATQIWLSGGRRRRVRSWRGACDTSLDARGATFAVADRGHAVECPRRGVPPERISGSSCGPVLSGIGGTGNRSTDRRIP